MRILATIIALTLAKVVSGVGILPSEKLLFEPLTVKGVNISSRIFAVVQDPFGFVWFGTDYGLIRYDGYRTLRIESSDLENSGLLGVVGVESLALGNDTTLWIGTNKGIYNLDLRSWAVQRPAQFHNHTVRTLLNQGDSLLWIGTGQGLYKYDLRDERLVHYNNANSNLSQNIIRALYRDREGNMWVGTADKLNLLSAGREVFESFDLKKASNSKIKHNLVLDIKPLTIDNDSILLVGTETGLCLFDRFSHTYITIDRSSHELTNEVVKTIYAKNREEIYFGTDQGFNKMNLRDGKVEQFYHNPFNQYTIVNNQIWDIYPDRNGNLWLATSNGISKLNINPEAFSYFPVTVEKGDVLAGTKVADLVEDGSDTLWIASSSGLLSAIEKADGSMALSRVKGSTPLSIDNINAVSIDQKGRVWIGSVAGINILDPATGRIFIPPMDDGAGTRVSSNYISTIIKGEKNRFWIGTWGGGLYRADAGKQRMEEIDIQYVADINGQFADGEDYLWALNGNSLSRFNKNSESVEAIENVEGLASHFPLLSLCYGKDQKVWLGSRNALLKYDIVKDSIEVIGMPVGEEFMVTGLIEDQSGILWGSSENTLFWFDTHSRRFHYFPLPATIPMKKLDLSPFREMMDGEILVCGFDGFLKLLPQDFQLADVNPRVMITSVEVNGEPLYPGKVISGKVITNKTISSSDKLVLPFKSSNVRLEYSSFSFGDPGQERFAYMLKGFDSHWMVSESGSNSMDYINLAPGTYTFMVKSYSGEMDNPVSSLELKIRFPLWASPPIVILYILLLLFILGVIIYQYRNRLKTKVLMNQMQFEKDQNELQNSSKLKFYINISHELLTSISLITDPLKQVLLKSDLKEELIETLKLIERNANYLKIYIDQLLNFRKIEIGQHEGQLKSTLDLVVFCKEIVESFKGKALSKGLTLKLKADLKKFLIETDEEKLYSIIQNLISNAIKFTPKGGEVVLSIKVKSENEFIVSVRDNGIGIDRPDQKRIFERFHQINHEQFPKRGMGIGLTIVKDFVEVLQGTIELKSEPGAGTRVKVILPTSIKLSKKLEEEPYTKEYISQDAITQTRTAPLLSEDIQEGLPLVLLVDEIRDLYEYISFSLRKKYNIIWAPSGGEALEIIKKSSVTLIISEIQLPDINGIAFCKQVRNNVKTSRIPIILLTSKKEMENQLKAIEAGVDVFLAKPFEIEVLEANIANLLRNLEKTEAFITRRLLLKAPEVEVDSKDDKLLKEVVEYIHKHMENSRIQAIDISYAMGISHSNLYRKIKGITGQSLSEFIRFVRLQKAEQLLSTGELAVSEVMFQVGFTNHSYFSKCFRKLYKVTPKNYSKLA